MGKGKFAERKTFTHQTGWGEFGLGQNKKNEDLKKNFHHFWWPSTFTEDGLLRSSSSSSGSMTYYYEDQGDTRFIFLRGRENPRTHQIKSFESVLRVKQQKSAMGKNLLIKKQTSKFHTNGIQGQQTIWENSAPKKILIFFRLALCHELLLGEGGKL